MCVSICVYVVERLDVGAFHVCNEMQQGIAASKSVESLPGGEK